MILQLEHEHKPKQSPTVSSKKQPKTNPKINKHQQSIEIPQPIFFTPKPSLEISTYDFHIEGLQQIHKQSMKYLPQFINSFIYERKKFSEERVYEATVNNAVDFVGIHFREFKTGLKFQMQSMFEDIHSGVEAGIWDGRYEIDQSRKKYFTSVNKEKRLLSYITNELVQRNLESFDENDLEDIEDIDASATMHAKTEIYKTKKAEDFVNKMREKQIKRIEELTKKLEQQRMKQYKTIEQQQLQQQQRKREKKQLIRRRMEKHSQLVLTQRERHRKIHSDYLKMISLNKKPLFKIREQRYNKSVLEDLKIKYKLLQNLKDQKRPINFDQIDEHMVKYAELLSENQSFRQQQRELKESQYEVIASKRPYRSRFHSLVLRDTPKIDEKGIKTSLLRKKIDYADYVRHNFIPRIDDRKHEELQALINRINRKQDTNYSRRYMHQGKQNLERLHFMIEQYRAKNKLKQEQEPIGLSKQASFKYKNYLQELKQSKQKEQNKGELNFEQKMKSKDDEEIKMISMQNEAKAKQKQHYLNQSIKNINLQSHMQGNTMIEQSYINAAKAKMAILKKYKLQDSTPQGDTASPS